MAETKNMQCLAFYGKGGIGKSTVAAGVSVSLARAGQRVLHVGCDPKHDSTLPLVGGRTIPTVIEKIFSRPTRELRPEDFIVRGEAGIDCIESGGPEPGVGCGGRAVSRMFEVLEERNVISARKYDVAVFDVLGDVVCGGFAAPLKSAFAPKVIIVLSEELAAAYAANNIAKGVARFLGNGIVLAGAVLNLRDNRSEVAPVEKFLQRLSVELLAVLPRDERVQQAEMEGTSVALSAPDSEVARALGVLAGKLFQIDKTRCRPPSPMELGELRQIMSRR